MSIPVKPTTPHLPKPYKYRLRALAKLKEKLSQQRYQGMPQLKLFDRGHLTLEAINLIHRANGLSAYLDGLVDRSAYTEGLTFAEINAQFDELIKTLEPMVAPHNVDEYVVFPHA